MSWKKGYSYCMVQSVEGPLMNWTDKQWNEAVAWTTKGDGTKFASGREVKAEYLRLHGEGWRVIRAGSCDNHHKVKGCMGHKQKKDEQ